jgi:hypothetical protein
MKLLVTMMSLALLAPCGFGQAKTNSGSAAPDRMGMTCTQILRMTSSKWVSVYTLKKGENPENTIRAIKVYGACYDARTDRLPAALAKIGKGPPMGATGNFRDFDAAVKDFMAKALGATEPPADAVKSAYAALYEKQFRYDFYRSYEQNSSSPALVPSPDDLDQVGTAKNQFGQELNLLPTEKIREVHAAFSRIFDAVPISDATKLALYRFAIFCLEKPSAEPFSQPPF